MKYFLDTEFIEYIDDENRARTDLISIALVREDGKEFYKVLSHHNYPIDVIEKDNWIKKNVYKPAMNELFKSEEDPDTLVAKICEYNYTRKMLKKDLLEFFKDDPDPVSKREIIASYGAYDFTLLCEVVSFRSAPFRVWYTELEALKGDLKVPKQSSEAHIALHDAQYNKEVYEFIMNNK